MRPEALEILDRLIAFDTVPSRSNLYLIDYTQSLLRKTQADIELVASPDGSKANLIARIGPPVAGGVVLSGHSDVVSVEGQSWSTEPFRLVSREGRLFGRGTADMKGFVALMLAAATAASDRQLQRPLWLALSYDEEAGCLGVPHLLDRLVHRPDRPALAIIGEPTGMQPVNAHKGFNLMRVDIKGRPAHSSSPLLGASAILPAATFITQLERYFMDRVMSRQPIEGFEPGYTTLNVGRISGGEAINIIPGHCGFDWEFREVPGDDINLILADVEKLFDASIRVPMAYAGADCEAHLRKVLSVLSLSPERDGAAEALVKRLTGSNAAHAVAFGTEAGFFQAAGISAVVCGPGNIAQAHQPDEFIEISQMSQGEIFMDRLVDTLAA